MTHSLPALRIDVMSSQPPSRLRDPARLSPEEAALLELEERRGLPVHVGSVLIFEGSTPTLAELVAHVAARLDRVPRYRRRIVEVPLRAGRPVWAEDPHLHLAHHLRHEALPGPADEAALARLASRVFSQPIDRGKPLWELCLVEGLHGGRFALLSKSHAALVDGAANPDIATALLDESAAPPPPGRAPDGVAGPLPSRGQLLATALAERASDPRETLRTLERAASRVREELEARNLEPLARIGAPPPTLLNGPVGPHRRFAFADAELAALRRAKDRLGGTVNDIVLAAVAGAVGRALREQGEHTDGLVLRALIPVADARNGQLLAAYAPLPVGIGDARRRHMEISRALDGLRASGRVSGADVLSAVDGFAPAGMLVAAARLQTRQRAFNLVVTNVPGPQQPRYLLGRALRAIHPAMPLARNQGASVAAVSYDGRVCFGLLGDYDAAVAPDALAAALRDAIAELAPPER